MFINYRNTTNVVYVDRLTASESQRIGIVHIEKEVSEDFAPYTDKIAIAVAQTTKSTRNIRRIEFLV